MNFLVVILSILSLAVGGDLRVQSNKEPRQSPKDAVTQFMVLEADGGRLTRQGWNAANKFFIHATEPPQHLTIHVISSRYPYKVDEISRTDKTAEVYVAAIELGRLDSELRFRRPSDPAVSQTLWKYNLIFGDAPEEIADDGKGPTTTRGPMRWRIDKPQAELIITLKTAIQYVVDIRDKSTDPMVKQNAAETLSMLTRLE